MQPSRTRCAYPSPNLNPSPDPNPKQDKAIADKVCKQAKSCILVGNKSDLLTDKEWEAFRLKVETDLRMIPWAPLVRASVLTGQGVEEAI